MTRKTQNRQNKHNAKQPYFYCGPSIRVKQENNIEMFI